VESRSGQALDVIVRKKHLRVLAAFDAAVAQAWAYHGKADVKRDI
jgi:hypothetical protein